MDQDRTVHAQLDDAQLARYDRSGKWYIESRTERRKAVSVAGAVEFAIRADERGGKVFLNRAGGTAFDAKFRRAKAARG